MRGGVKPPKSRTGKITWICHKLPGFLVWIPNNQLPSFCSEFSSFHSDASAPHLQGSEVSRSGLWLSICPRGITNSTSVYLFGCLPSPLYTLANVASLSGLAALCVDDVRDSTAMEPKNLRTKRHHKIFQKIQYNWAI